MFGSKKKIELLDQEITNLDQELNDFAKEVIKCNKETENLRNSVESLKTLPSLGSDYAQRLIEVEAKLGKLWSMLVEVSPTTGREKLTKIGRRFGGKSGYTA